MPNERLFPDRPYMAKVALIGRPNVGKSTLFNRLTGKRLAVTHDVAGTTRDRNTASVEWAGKSFEVIDTAGMVHSSKSDMMKELRSQSLEAIEEADIIVLCLDYKDGFQDADRELLNLIRKSSKPFFVAINKVENPKHTSLDEFLKIGSDLWPISAIHGKGIGDLLDAIILLLPEQKVSKPEKTFSIVVIGRPNVGKSTIINALLGKERMIVSEVPGTTIDIVGHEMKIGENDVVIYDTAGVRKTGKVESDVEYFGRVRSLESVKNADIAIIVLSAPEGVTAQDKRLISLVKELGIGVIIAANKWDILEDEDHTIRAMKRQLQFIPFAIFTPLSGKTGLNIEELKLAVARAIFSTQVRVNIHDLNEYLHILEIKNSHKLMGTKKPRLKYAVQLSSRPPVLAVFASHSKLIEPTYLRFLENSFREKFGFEGVPVKIVLKEKKSTRS